MPSRISRLIVVFAATLAWTGSAFASTPALLFGQQHAYSVTMRGNGETIVSARIAITNQTEAAQKAFAFEIPGLNVSEIVGYQQHLADTCLDYGYNKSLPNTTDMLARPCLQSSPPDYTITSYYSGATYTKLSLQSDGNGKYHTTLPTVTEPGKSTAIILAYAGTGYATKQLPGAYDFKFQTIKVADRIENLTVAVDVDAGQYLDGGTAKVGYESTTKPASATSVDAKAASNAQLDSIASRIGNDGSLSKTAKGLSSGESFAVKGVYADAVWKLHPWRLVTGLAAALLILTLMIMMVVRLRRQGWPQLFATHHGQAHPKTATPGTAPHTSLVDAASIITGFTSSLLLMLVIWGWTAYSERVYTGDAFTAILTAILALLSCALIVIAPVIWLAVSRRDWRVGVYVVVWQVVWLIAFLVIYQLTLRPATPPEIMPYYGVDSQGSSTAK